MFFFGFKRVLDRGPEQRASKLTVLCMLIFIILISHIIIYYVIIKLLIMENHPSQNPNSPFEMFWFICLNIVICKKIIWEYGKYYTDNNDTFKRPTTDWSSLIASSLTKCLTAKCFSMKILGTLALLGSDLQKILNLWHCVQMFVCKCLSLNVYWSNVSQLNACLPTVYKLNVF
jgi:hypothetical protein